MVGMRRALRGGLAAASVAAVAILCGSASAYYEPPAGSTETVKLPANRTFRLDGKFVHNVGRLHLQVTNIGQTGNAANPARTTVPSAEYPPGSGVDHLYAAGLWVGAVDASGIPHVTTAAYAVEKKMIPRAKYTMKMWTKSTGMAGIVSPGVPALLVE